MGCGASARSKEAQDELDKQLLGAAYEGRTEDNEGVAGHQDNPKGYTVQHLLSLRASASAADEGGRTAAMCAALNGHEAALRFLVKARANLAATTHPWKLLAKKGSACESRAGQGETALDWAKKGSACERILLDAGAKPVQRVGSAPLKPTAPGPKQKPPDPPQTSTTWQPLTQVETTQGLEGELQILDACSESSVEAIQIGIPTSGEHLLA